MAYLYSASRWIGLSCCIFINNRIVFQNNYVWWQRRLGATGVPGNWAAEGTVPSTHSPFNRPLLGSLRWQTTRQAWWKDRSLCHELRRPICRRFTGNCRALPADGTAVNAGTIETFENFTVITLNVEVSCHGNMWIFDVHIEAILFSVVVGWDFSLNAQIFIAVCQCSWEIWELFKFPQGRKWNTKTNPTSVGFWVNRIMWPK